MRTEEELLADEWAYGRSYAVEAYATITGRSYFPGDEVTMQISDLMDTDYQIPYKTLEEFKSKRCVYDEETNQELIDLVTSVMLGPDVPPIYIHEYEPGKYALVDGCHRLSAHIIAGRTTIQAQIGARND